MSREGPRDVVASAKASKSSFGGGRSLGLTLRAQPRIPPPTIARPPESSATLEDGSL
jgi:hypothetical protein